jgi:hypothetical protein
VYCDAGEDSGDHDLAGRSGQWLISRLRKLERVAQFGPIGEQLAALAEMDLVLAEARRRGDRAVFLPMLEGTVSTQVSPPGAGHRAEQLITELLDYARRHGLWLHEANAYAALGRQAVFAGQRSNARTPRCTPQASRRQPRPTGGRHRHRVSANSRPRHGGQVMPTALSWLPTCAAAASREQSPHRSRASAPRQPEGCRQRKFVVSRPLVLSGD